MELFRLFVFSQGVFSSFRFFAWGFYRLFVFLRCVFSPRKDEKTKWHNSDTIATSILTHINMCALQGLNLIAPLSTGTNADCLTDSENGEFLFVSIQDQSGCHRLLSKDRHLKV